MALDRFVPRDDGWGRRRVLALVAAGCSAAVACTVVASVPLRLVEGYPVVPGSLAGVPVSFLLDTGAQGMLVTPEVAERLGLPLAGMTRIFGTGVGAQQVRVVRLPGLRLGGAPMPDVRAPVAPLPVAIPAEPVLAGLLGAALLSRFDLLIDVPGGRLVLQSPGDCAPPAGRRLPLEVSRAGEPYLPVRVNGQPMTALLDTGSRATLLTEGAARRLGVAAPVAASTARGIDGEHMALQYVRVRLGLGDMPDVEMPVSAAPIRLERADLLLGLDVLGRQKVFLSYAAGVAVFS